MTRRTKGIVLGFLLLMIVDVLGQVGFKYTAIEALPLALDFQWFARVVVQPWLWVALACYVATFFIWLTLLRVAPVGPSFAASHMEIVMVMFVSVHLFDESLSVGKLVGATFIMVGIVCLAVAETRLAAPHGPSALVHV